MSISSRAVTAILSISDIPLNKTINFNKVLDITFIILEIYSVQNLKINKFY